MYKAVWIINLSLFIILFKESIIKIRFDRPTELVLKENVGWLEELDVFFQGLHFGADNGEQVFLSGQILNWLGLEDTVEVSLCLARVVDNSATFTAKMQHRKVDLWYSFKKRQRFDLGLRLIWRVGTHIKLIESSLSDLMQSVKQKGSVTYLLTWIEDPDLLVDKVTQGFLDLAHQEVVEFSVFSFNHADVVRGVN